ASLLEKRDEYDIATGNDADADRHGIVTPDGGLMNPNPALDTALRYLVAQRPDWPATAKVGKTLVSSSLIDRVVGSLGRELYEVPVGFKWFVPGLIDSSVGFGGEESAGASFLRRDGSVWTTDKDGIILALLASAITEAPAGGAIGGLKVSTESAWFAARPSGTEDIYKIYAESFKGEEHLSQVQDAAKALVDEALAD